MPSLSPEALRSGVILHGVEVPVLMSMPVELLALGLGVSFTNYMKLLSGNSDSIPLANSQVFWLIHFITEEILLCVTASRAL